MTDLQHGQIAAFFNSRSRKCFFIRVFCTFLCFLYCALFGLFYVFCLFYPGIFLKFRREMKKWLKFFLLHFWKIQIALRGYKFNFSFNFHFIFRNIDNFFRYQKEHFKNGREIGRAISEVRKKWEVKKIFESFFLFFVSFKKRRNSCQCNIICWCNKICMFWILTSQASADVKPGWLSR